MVRLADTGGWQLNTRPIGAGDKLSHGGWMSNVNLRTPQTGGGRKFTLADTFCSCIKKVKAGSRLSESAAIAICVKSVLGTRGKTLRKFQCRKPRILKTRRLRRRSA